VNRVRTAQTALRTVLDRIVEPPPSMVGRHRVGLPPQRPPFAADEWARGRWAEVAGRHGVEEAGR
jgi:hypothetical protein